MIAFDTNVVVRLLVEDDPTQLALAKAELERAESRGQRVLLTEIVLCELEWVLESAYQVPRPRILEAIQRLAADARFTFQDRTLLLEALDRYQQGKGDLSDYLLGLRATAEQAETTFTFDRALQSEMAFTVLNRLG